MTGPGNAMPARRPMAHALSGMVTSPLITISLKATPYGNPMVNTMTSNATATARPRQRTSDGRRNTATTATSTTAITTAACQATRPTFNITTASDGMIM